MSNIDRKIRDARNRLNFNTLADGAALGLIVAGCAWGLYVIVERAFVFGWPLAASLWAALALAAVVAGVDLYRRRTSMLAAAVVVDQRAGLKERLSSAMTLRRSSDPFAQAAVRDAERVAGSVHVPAHVGLTLPSRFPGSVVVLAAAAIVYGLMPQLNLLSSASAATSESAELARAEQENIELAMKTSIASLEEKAQSNDALRELASDLQGLALPEKPAATPDDVRREALQRIDSVREKFEERRRAEQFNRLEELKNQLRKLEMPKGNDPASKLQKSLAEGDMESARKAAEQLKEQLEEAAKSGDEDARKQLEELGRKLDNIAENLQKLDMTQDLKKLEKELENKAGLTEEQAKELIEQLKKMDPDELKKAVEEALKNSGMSQQEIQKLAQKMADKKEALKQCQNMAQALSKCAQACQNPGQGQGTQQGEGMQAAQAALDQLGQQLSDAEMAQQLSDELDAQLNQLGKMRDGVCQGGFCPNPNPDFDKVGPQGGNEGLGYGARIGEEAVAHNYEKNKEKTRATAGAIIGQMLIDGPQLSGESTAEVQEAVAAAYRDATDAIDREKISRQHAELTKRYFEKLAGLAPGTIERVQRERAAEKPAEDE